MSQCRWHVNRVFTVTYASCCQFAITIDVTIYCITVYDFVTGILFPGVKRILLGGGKGNWPVSIFFHS